MKIIAIGMNYSLHCQELHADEALPQEPVIFMKPDSALLKDSKPFFIGFHLDIDGNTVQRGNTADMLFGVDRIIAYVSRFCTLKIGDLLFTGTPVGVGPVRIGNHLEGYLENDKVLDFYIR